MERALAEWNCEFDKELFYAWGGLPIVEIIATLNKQRGLRMPVELVAQKKETYFYELLPQLRAVPEVLEHIQTQHRRIPFAVVSGSTRESCQRVARFPKPSGKIRYTRLCGRLQEQQTPSRISSTGRIQTGSGSQALLGL